MGNNNKEMSLTDVMVAQPTITDQNELIMQLMHQIAEMRVEMDKTRDLKILVIIAKTPTLDNERPPLHFPSSDTTSEHFLNNSTTSTTPKPSIIDLTTPNPYHASSLH